MHFFVLSPTVYVAIHEREMECLKIHRWRQGMSSSPLGGEPSSGMLRTSLSLCSDPCCLLWCPGLGNGPQTTAWPHGPFVRQDLCSFNFVPIICSWMNLSNPTLIFCPASCFACPLKDSMTEGWGRERQRQRERKERPVFHLLVHFKVVVTGPG